MASLSPVRARLTLDEFLAIPGFDEQRLELIDGEISEEALMPRWEHGYVAGELYVILRQFGFASVEPRAIIPSAGSWGASSPIPDVAFYRSQPPAPDGWMRSPPDVAIEVLSVGQPRTSMRAKVELYLRFGVKSVWVVDLERRNVDIYEGGTRRTLDSGDVIETPVVPGMRVDLGELFASYDQIRPSTPGPDA